MVHSLKTIWFFVFGAILLYLIPYSVSSQGYELSLKNALPVPGISLPVVQTVFQDSQGFIWLGGPHGLARYDGYQLKTYRYIPGDTTSNPATIGISNIYEDEQGILWVGTNDNMLLEFDRNTELFRKYIISPGLPSSYPHTHVYSFFVDSENIKWIGTRFGGLKKFDDKNKTFITYVQNPDNMSSYADLVFSIHQLSDSLLLLDTGLGLYSFNKSTNEFSPFSIDHLLPKKFHSASTTEICKDKNGNFWLGTSVGLIKYLPTKNTAHVFEHDPSDPNSLPANNIYGILIDPLNNGNRLWLYSRVHFSSIDINTNEIIRYGDPSIESERDQLLVGSDMIIDKSGIMWFATDNAGILTLDMRENPFTTYDLYDESNNRYAGTAFCKDSEGFLWVGTFYAGLFKYDQDMNLIAHYLDFPRTYYYWGYMDYYSIYSLMEDSNKDIWVSTWNMGIYKYERKKNSFRAYRTDHPEAKIGLMRGSEVLEDHEGWKWTCGNAGAYYLKNDDLGDEFHIVDDSLLQDAFIRSFCEDTMGNVWFATMHAGVFCLEEKNRDSLLFTQYHNDPSDPGSLSSNNVYAVHTDKSGVVWVGTSNGLNRFDHNTKSFECFNSDNELDADFIYCIQSDNSGNIWLTSENKLVRFSPGAVQGQKSKVYDLHEGIPFDKVFVYNFNICSDGKLYAGGERKTGDTFFCFSPDSLKDNQHIPPIVITNFKVRNQRFKLDSSISMKKQITLKYNDNFFEFEFAALDFKNSPKNQYAYMLEGVDEEWVYSKTRRYANYTKVKPGDYFFRVKGSNNDGYWNEEGTSIMISVLPPPWATWYAYSVYGLLFLLVLYGLRKYDLNRQKLKQDLEVEKVEAEKLKEVDKMKSQFFANISHEFRTPLTLILGPINKILNKNKDKETDEDLSLIQRNALRLKRLINQLLSLSKIESGQMKLNLEKRNVIPLIKGYVQSFESLAKQKNIELTFKTERDDIPPMLIDQDKMEKILFNLLSNAFKFTEEGGKIDVFLSLQSTVPSPQISTSNKRTEDWRLETVDIEYLRIIVSDTGKGIPKDRLSHIFDRFYQADHNYVREQEGTGIGLALTKELVELHKGSIDVESEEGVGSTFRVFLPLIANDEDDLSTTGSTQHTAKQREVRHRRIHSTQGIGKQKKYIEEDYENKPGTCNLQPATHNPPESDFVAPLLNLQPGTFEKDSDIPIILLVEDNSDLRLYIRGFLDDTFQVIEAKNGEQGLERAIQYIPDLIISDVMMPKIDGYQLCDKVKSDQRTSHIPVILLTARASKESKIEGLETGADDFITKPFDPDELLVRVRNLIEQRAKLKEFYLEGISKSDLSALRNIPSSGISGYDREFLERAVAQIEKNLSNSEFTIEEFSELMHISRVQLHRKLKALTGKSASEFLRYFRLNKANEMIKDNKENITAIAYDVGFNNLSYFSKCFKEQFGVLPSDFKG